MQQYIIHESATISTITNKAQPSVDYIEFTTILQKANEVNRNGRFYSKKVLEDGLNQPHIQNAIQRNAFYGEGGHPSDKSFARQTKVDPRNIAFLIKEVWWEGDLLMGRCQTACTEVGRDMMGLIRQGSQVAFSLRAQGNYHRDSTLNALVIESPIFIICYDWVVNPSHSDAYIQSLNEERLSNILQMDLKVGDRQVVLTEAVDVFQNGRLIDINEAETMTKCIDYAAHATEKVKPVKNMYRFNEEDKIFSITDNKNIITLENNGVYKKVTTEDYVTKDIRHRIRGL